MEDSELLREYVSSRSEGAFSRLVERHINLVYSTAFRVVQESHLAKDVAQDVFIALAKNPRAIKDASLLPAWLYRTTRFTAAATIRTERRRREREHRAAESPVLVDRATFAWEGIDADLDQALDALGPIDQSAIALRFLEGKSLRAVGQALGVSDDAAQKRVSRALENLRAYLKRRGVGAEVAAIGAALTAASVQAIPAGLSAPVTAAALAAAPLAVGVLNGALSAFFMTKIQTLLVTAMIVSAAVGSFVYQQRKINDLIGQNADLQRQLADSAKIGEEHQRLSDSYSALEHTRQAEQRELLRFRASAAKEESDQRSEIAHAEAPLPDAEKKQIGTVVAGHLADIEIRVAAISQAVNAGKLLEMTATFNEINELCDDLQGKNKNVAPSAEEWNLGSEQYQAALKLLAGMENDVEGLRSIAAHTKAPEPERVEMMQLVWNQQFKKRYSELQALLAQGQVGR